MSLPTPHEPMQIEILPARPGLPAAAARPTELDVLVRVRATEPPPEMLLHTPMRPPLNLALVLDRSGSMGGEKMEFARQAALFAVDQLRADDRVSVVAFDSEVEVVAPSMPATSKDWLKDRIRRIQPRGSTALHGGWVEGGAQVGVHLRQDQLNRVMLFTDGQANIGETRPGVIAQDARGLAQRGISTTTLGIGLDYNEDLLEAMARAGDGNYYFIESPSQLASLFAAELRGLLATAGRAVSLGVEPAAGVEVLEVYNDFERNAYGRLMLPNVTMGQAPVEVALRLRVPVGFGGGAVCAFRLAWDDPKTGARRKLRQSLTLDRMPVADFDALPALPEVAVAVALLQAAREKRLAVQAMERGDVQTARRHVDLTRGYASAAPACPATASEMASLDRLDAELAAPTALRPAGAPAAPLPGGVLKRVKEEIYRRTTGRGDK